MGLELSILPYEAETKTISFSHSILGCYQDYKLFEDLMALEKKAGEDVGKKFLSYLSVAKDGSAPEGDSHYGTTSKTPYGDPMKFVLAGDVVEIFKKHHVEFQLYVRNRAVMRYLEELPTDTKLALYWH